MLAGMRLTSGGNLLARGGHADDDALTPALVTRLEGSPHNANVARAVERIIAAPVCHLDELLNNGLVLEVIWVDKVRRAKLLGPRLLGGVDVDDDDLAGLVGHSALNDGQPNAAAAEDGHAGALVDLCRDASGAIAGRDAAAQQTGAVHGGVGLNSNDGDVGDDGELGKGRGAHEVEKLLALALEAGGAVGHNSLALRGPNFAAEIGLARLAELALLALGGAAGARVSDGLAKRRVGVLLEGNDMVAGLHVGDALADRLDNSGAFMSQDDRERALGVLSRQCVGIWPRSGSVAWRREGPDHLTCVADTDVVNLDADLVGFGRSDLDILDGQVLASRPGHGGLAGD